MKTITSLALIALITAVTAMRTFAYYDHDDQGYWDQHHVHHPYIYYHSHRGYWDHNDKGVRIFINI